jgi:hypothetical protein
MSSMGCVIPDAAPCFALAFGLALGLPFAFAPLPRTAGQGELRLRDTATACAAPGGLRLSVSVSRRRIASSGNNDNARGDANPRPLEDDQRSRHFIVCRGVKRRRCRCHPSRRSRCSTWASSARDSTLMYEARFGERRLP